MKPMRERPPDACPRNDDPAPAVELPCDCRRRALILGLPVTLLSVAGVAGLGLWAGGFLSPAPAARMRDHRVPQPKTTPKLVIARGKSPKKNVAAALGKMGGMKKFVTSRDVVLIKPNVGWDRTPSQAANTDPGVVAALVRACRDAGAKEVIVTDCPVNEAERSFRRSGILKAAQQVGAQVILPEQSRYVSLKIPGKLGSWSVLEPFVRATKIINVPVAKHHGSALVTAGMKNWIGVVGERRSMLHVGLDESIAGLAELMRPTLTVVDATRVLLRNGPRGGDLGDVKREDAIAVSLDPVAVDAWAATILGFKPAKVGYLGIAAKRKLGRTSFKALSPVTIKVT